MKPLNDSSFTYHRDVWPYRPLAKFTSGAVQVQREALMEAEAALKDFAEVREAIVSDKSLSGAGKQAQLKGWADKNLTALRERVDEINERSMGLEKTLEIAVTKQFTGESEVFQSRILDYLAGLKDETARISFLSQRLRQGDFVPLKAALEVPPYLAGVSEEMLADLRSEAMERVDPERTANIAVVRKGRETSELAVKAALRLIEGALAEPLDRGPAVNAPPPPRPAPPTKEQLEHLDEVIRANNPPEVLRKLDLAPDAPQVA